MGEILGEMFIGIVILVAICWFMGKISEPTDEIKAEIVSKNGVYVGKKEIVIRSGAGRLHFNASTGNPIGGRDYNPDDWMSHPEWVGKSEQQLKEMLNRGKEEERKENYHVITTERKRVNEIYKNDKERCILIEYDLEKIIHNLTVDNINYELFFGINLLFTKMHIDKSSVWLVSDNTLSQITPITRDLCYILENPNWRKNNEKKVNALIDKLKTAFSEVICISNGKENAIENINRVETDLESVIFNLNVETINLKLLKDIQIIFKRIQNKEENCVWETTQENIQHSLDILLDIRRIIQNAGWKETRSIEVYGKIDELKVAFLNFEKNETHDSNLV